MRVNLFGFCICLCNARCNRLDLFLCLLGQLFVWFGFQLYAVLDLNKPIDYFVIYFQYYWPFANKISNIKCGNVLASASELKKRVNGASFMAVWMSAHFFHLTVDDFLGHVTDKQLTKSQQD